MEISESYRNLFSWKISMVISKPNYLSKFWFQWIFATSDLISLKYQDWKNFKALSQLEAINTWQMNVPQIHKLHSLKVVIYITQSHEKTTLIFFFYFNGQNISTKQKLTTEFILKYWLFFRKYGSIHNHVNLLVLRQINNMTLVSYPWCIQGKAN